MFFFFFYSIHRYHPIKIQSFSFLPQLKKTYVQSIVKKKFLSNFKNKPARNDPLLSRARAWGVHESIKLWLRGTYKNKNVFFFPSSLFLLSCQYVMPDDIYIFSHPLCVCVCVCDSASNFWFHRIFRIALNPPLSIYIQWNSYIWKDKSIRNKVVTRANKSLTFITKRI